MGKRKSRRDYLAKRDSEPAALPKKRFYRQRAHVNLFGDHDLEYPISPATMNWLTLFPAVDHLNQKVEIVDVGCGFGGLLFPLSTQFPSSLILGMEIRHAVAEFVVDKIRAMRTQNASTNAYQNIACLRANSMKYMPNFFVKGQISKMFFCFPDPHFKARKHKARVISSTLVAEYAYLVRPGGIVYTITDVEDLHIWMADHFRSCLLFEEISEDEFSKDPCVEIMRTETEEGKKVERNSGKKLLACFRRLEDPPWPQESTA